jgi:hypothetical protein
LIYFSGGPNSRGVLSSRTIRGDQKIMDQVDLAYYRGRIAEEEIAAQRAPHPDAAASHKKLAEEYASLLIANGHSALARAQA